MNSIQPMQVFLARGEDEGYGMEIRAESKWDKDSMKSVQVVVGMGIKFQGDLDTFT